MRIVAIQENIKESSTPYRLLKNLRERGVDFSLFTLSSGVDDPNIRVVIPSFLEKVRRKISISLKRFIAKKNSLFIDKNIPFSYLTDYGINLSKRGILDEADIIQIHWLGGSFLSPNEIKRISKLGKPVVFVNHDTAHFTGGCHIRLGCEKYANGCGGCPELHSEKESLTHSVIDKKRKSIEPNNTFIVSPSSWMDECVGKSVVFKDCLHYRIPNAVNTDLFLPMDKVLLRNKYGISLSKKVLLFGAVNATEAPHKGYRYLIEALRILCNTENICDYTLVVFGADSGTDIDSRLEVRYLGRLSESQMIEAYNLADVYVFPSIDDNFPGTVLEASSCEIPTVAFSTGGVPDIVEHKKTGYLAKYMDSEDLTGGIEWVVNNNDNNLLGKASRQKMEKEFSRDIVAEKYISLYKEILSFQAK